jgi:uncharacterized protein (TIGR03083 family)
MAGDTDQFDGRLAALRHSHERLADVVGRLDAEALELGAYPSEWSIAQVLSHLGSSAEIFDRFVTAGIDDGPAPSNDEFGPIWERWNAKSPTDQARDSITADESLLERITALDEAQRERWRVDMFGSNRRLADLLGLRLNEHAVHTWDVAVALDPDATILPDAVDLVVDELGLIAQYTGKPPAHPVAIIVTTHDPRREFRLDAGPDAVTVSATESGSGSGGPSVRLPAEAFIRLVYGRLDIDHTPDVSTDGIDLDALRDVFPGP